jgi:hypothetical protein
MLIRDNVLITWLMLPISVDSRTTRSNKSTLRT